MFKDFFKRIWDFFDGWKTRLMMALGVLLQLAVILDPVMISQAFGLDQSGAAKISLALFLLGWLAREMAKKPGMIGKMLGKPD